MTKPGFLLVLGIEFKKSQLGEWLTTVNNELKCFVGTSNWNCESESVMK